MTTAPVPSAPGAPAPASAAAPAPADVADLAPGIPAALRHGRVENVLGLATGVVVVGTGLVVLHSAGAVTGGTAGLSLLLSYAGGWPVGLVLTLVNLPFIALAVRRRGWGFTLSSVACVLATSAVSTWLPRFVHVETVQPVAAVLLGDLLCGIGLLIVFRHRSSMGGFTILALVAEDKLGWRPGLVLMVLDSCVVLSSAAVVSPGVLALSAAGAVLLNVVLVLNHRPGRYLG